MKKIIVLVIVFAVALSLGGCFKKGENVDQDDSRSKQFTSLSDWFKNGKGVRCVIETPQGEVIISAKGKQVRMDGIAYVDMANPVNPEDMQNGVSLTDAEWVYMWNGKNGIKMNIEEMNKMSNEAGAGEKINPEDYSWESWISDQEAVGVNYECKEENLSDNVFQVPNDVEFKDLGEMMKSLNSLSNDFQGSLGESEEMPSFEGSQNMNQEDIEARLEEMMKNSGVK